MSLILDILNEMWTTSLNYKGVTVNIFGIPQFKNKNFRSLNTTLNRLERIRYINKSSKGWNITKKGKMYVKKHSKDFVKLASPFKITSPRNLILMFDIPEDMRKARNWLRDQLKFYNYKMVQQSVWIGPSPLPEDFKKYIKKIEIKKYIKTYKLSVKQK